MRRRRGRRGHCGGAAINRRPNIGRTAASRDRAGARAYGRSPSRFGSRHLTIFPQPVAAVRSLAIVCCCAADWHALSASHLPRGAPARSSTCTLCRRGQETARAAQQLGVTPADNRGVRRSYRAAAGPPWTQEHRRAYAAGIAVLAGHARDPSSDSSTMKAHRAVAMPRHHEGTETVRSVSAPGLVTGGLRTDSRLISRRVPEPGQRQHTTRHRSDIRTPSGVSGQDTLLCVYPIEQGYPSRQRQQYGAVVPFLKVIADVTIAYDK
jgi:hypothetical protein